MSKHCKFCRKSFNRSQYTFKLESIARFSKRKFCSKKCSGAWRSGPRSAVWKGGITKYKSSYVFDKKTGRAIHRIIMERYLQRPLRPSPVEVVHHLNGDKQDNRLSNLRVLTGKQHAYIHWREKLSRRSKLNVTFGKWIAKHWEAYSTQPEM